MSAKKNTLIKLLIEKHIMVWNEPDTMAKQAAISEIYTPEIKITNPEGKYKGIEAVYNAIEIFRQANPGTVLKLNGTPAMHHNSAYYHWSLIKENQQVAHGVDFVIFKDGLIKSVFTFMD